MPGRNIRLKPTMATSAMSLMSGMKVPEIQATTRKPSIPRNFLSLAVHGPTSATVAARSRHCSSLMGSGLNNLGIHHARNSVDRSATGTPTHAHSRKPISLPV